MSEFCNVLAFSGLGLRWIFHKWKSDGGTTVPPIFLTVFQTGTRILPLCQFVRDSAGSAFSRRRNQHELAADSNLVFADMGRLRCRFRLHPCEIDNGVSLLYFFDVIMYDSIISLLSYFPVSSVKSHLPK